MNSFAPALGSSLAEEGPEEEVTGGGELVGGAAVGGLPGV